MKERDTLSFRAQPGGLVNERDSGLTTPPKRSVEVVYDQTQVMDAWPASGDELGDRRVRDRGFEQFDEGFASSVPLDSGPVGVSEGYAGHPEEVVEERTERGVGLEGEADVGDPGAAGG